MAAPTSRRPRLARLAHSQPWRDAGGFTLVEMLVALAIAALLATLAMPSMAAYLQRQRLQAVAQDLAADMSQARQAATLAGTPRWLVVQEGPQWCWAVARTPGCGCGTPEPCQLQRVAAGDHPEVRRLQLTDGTPREARFDPAADRPAPGISAMLLGLDAQRWRVRMSRLGRASACTPDAGRGCD